MANLILIFIALGVYIWTTFGLRKMVLKKKEVYNYFDFRTDFPGGKYYSIVYTILSPIVFIIFLAAGAILSVRFSDGNNEIANGMLLAVSGLVFYNGVYEVVTSICPMYGILLRKHRNQCYVNGTDVKLLGLIKIVLSIILIGATLYFNGINPF